MYTVKLKNCGNIVDGTISIEESKLNIKHGINGTGKSTISKGLKIKHTGNLSELQSFYSDEMPEIEVDSEIGEVLVFDEEFVNQIVFVDDEVIGNSFEVFLKTDNYEDTKKRLEERVGRIHKILVSDEQIIRLRQLVNSVNSKFSTTATGALAARGMLKSIINRQSAVIPDELCQYETFIKNKDINIPWIDWKGKGDQFDIADKCPYCAELIDREQQDIKKDVFKNTYSKSDAQNLADMLGFLEDLQDYLNEEKYSTLVRCVKENVDSERIKMLFTSLCNEFGMILDRYNRIDEFGRRKIIIADIGELDKTIELMRFPVEDFAFFTSDEVKDVFAKTNALVDQLLYELLDIKKEMGELKAVLKATVAESQKDINEFLKIAGIHYEIMIEAEDEENSKTILRQLYSENPTEVPEIKKHLSWGEKNAFSLILFMYWAMRRNPGLIILDDPISSFDSNKKYALIHRLFMNTDNPNKVSFYNKTVLMLTHDFEPITDFVVVKKINQDKVSAAYIWNRNGRLYEKEISGDNDIIMIQTECEEIAKDVSINRIVRIAFLRKLSELNQRKGSWEEVYQILSSLIHGKTAMKKIGNNNYVEMSCEEIERGTELIRNYILDFSYENELANVFNADCIKELYQNEGNGYYKMVLFRELTELCPEIKPQPRDDGWFKYVDETYHIENDNLHYLDIRKFEIVPDYIIEMVDSFMIA